MTFNKYKLYWDYLTSKLSLAAGGPAIQAESKAAYETISIVTEANAYRIHSDPKITCSFIRPRWPLPDIPPFPPLNEQNEA